MKSTAAVTTIAIDAALHAASTAIAAFGILVLKRRFH